MVKCCPACGTFYSTDHAKRVYCSRPCAYANRPKRAIDERFRSFVSVGPDCWTWTGASNPVTGYGSFGVDRETMRAAHRVAWEIEHGPIAGGLFVCHRCDNRMCVRPDHLFLGTHADNMADMKAKGRAAAGPSPFRGEASPVAKLTLDAVRHIRSCDDRASDLARRYGVTPTLIRSVRARRVWKWAA